MSGINKDNVVNVCVCMYVGMGGTQARLSREDKKEKSG